MINFKFADVRWQATFGFFAASAAFLFLDAGGFALAFLGAAALHELGHLAAMAQLGAPVHRVELSASGMKIYRGGRVNSLGELVILLAGVGANILAALVLYLAGGGGAMKFSAANTALAMFNLLPLGGLDGGSILELLLVDWLGVDCGSRMASKVSFLFAALALTALLAAAYRYGFSMGMVLMGLLLCCALLSPKTYG